MSSMVAVALLVFAGQPSSALPAATTAGASMANPSNDTLPWVQAAVHSALPDQVNGVPPWAHGAPELNNTAGRSNDTLPWHGHPSAVDFLAHKHNNSLPWHPSPLPSRAASHNDALPEHPTALPSAAHHTNDTIAWSNDAEPWAGGAGATNGLSAASPLHADSVGAWARFCNDDACSVGCGMWLWARKSDCLKEAGRRSLQVKTVGTSVKFGVVYSPTDHCPCQHACDANTAIGCHVLNATVAADTFSYRFIRAGNTYHVCDDDNCPPGLS